MWFKSSIIVATLLAGSGAAAMATPYYSALNTSTNAAGSSLNSSTAFSANSFVAGSNTLSEVELMLDRTSSSLDSSGSIIITLNADNGLTGSSEGPGSVIYALTSIADTLLTVGAKSVIDLVNMGIVTLNPGSTYWIDVSRNGTSRTNIVAWNDTAAPTIGSANPKTASGYNVYDITNVTTNVSSGPEMAMCASNDNSCFAANGVAATLTYSLPSVPEPASLAILGSGLFTLGWSRRRRASKTTTK